MKFFSPLLEIYLVEQKKGKTKYKRLYRDTSHSFVKQWVQMIKANFQAATEANVRDWTNTLRTCAATKISIEGAAGMDYNGIVLGTGNTPVTISDYNLQTRIVHGSGAGQLDYKAMAWDPFQVVGSTAKFKSKRQFENKSGGTITVKETGLLATDQAGYHFLIVRDVLPTPVDVENTKIIEVRYTFQCTV